MKLDSDAIVIAVVAFGFFSFGKASGCTSGGSNYMGDDPVTACIDYGKPSSECLELARVVYAPDPCPPAKAED